MFENTPNQPTKSTKFRTKTWVGKNDDARGTYNKDSQMKFKTSMLKSSLWDYSDVYILVRRFTSIEVQAGDVPNNGNKEALFKNCASFTDFISEINNT